MGDDHLTDNFNDLPIRTSVLFRFKHNGDYFRIRMRKHSDYSARMEGFTGADGPMDRKNSTDAESYIRCRDYNLKQCIVYGAGTRFEIKPTDVEVLEIKRP